MPDTIHVLDTFLRCPPKLGEGVYVARGAVVVGDVTLGDFSSVWYSAVLRGDINRIVVGNHTNIQDNAVLHVNTSQPCSLGNLVTVGHGAIVHACTVGDEVLVGMGAVILDGATIGAQTVIGAQSLVKEGAVIPPGSLAVGVPARVVRPLTPAERSQIRNAADHYSRNAAYCLQHKINVGGPLPAWEHAAAAAGV